jgi:hypothetical protein
MSQTTIMIICAVVLFFIFVMYRGDRLLKAKDKLDRRMEEIYGPMTEIVDNVNYQGGFPPMPKPVRLSLGITESELVLFDKLGNNGRVEYGKIKKTDRFTTKTERKRKFGLMAYGPLAMVLNKPTFRYFFTVEYIDIDNDDNILVFMVGTREIADNLYKTIKPYVKRKKGR